MPLFLEILLWGFLASPVLAFPVFLVKVLALTRMPAYDGLHVKIMATTFAVIVMTVMADAIFVSTFLATTSGAWKCSSAAISLLYTVVIWLILARLCKLQRRSE